MSLKAVLIKIGNQKQGLVMGLYNRQFRWNGTNHIVLTSWKAPMFSGSMRRQQGFNRPTGH
eukprot:9709291-Prorocentrum_lima.AAC.1